MSDRFGASTVTGEVHRALSNRAFVAGMACLAGTIYPLTSAGGGETSPPKDDNEVLGHAAAIVKSGASASLFCAGALLLCELLPRASVPVVPVAIVGASVWKLRGALRRQVDSK